MDDLFDVEDAQEQQYAALEKARIERHKLINGAFGTDIGLKCLEAFENTYVNVPIYTKNSTLEDVAYRQAKADLIKDIRKELNNG